jgi:peptidoglycan/xylan/chitin deacetylase (PgdA/CDA1 family)
LRYAAVIVTAITTAASAAETGSGVPILVYHRFGPVVADSMTVTTPVFEAQLAWLRQHGYTFVPLRSVVDAICGNEAVLPSKSVSITADDGHASIYSEMFPIVQRHQLPLTLFIYPSAISNASSALTWDQLGEMARAGIEVQSHTFWHPNFRTEKARLPAAEYRTFLDTQLGRSRARIAARLGIAAPDMLAWPFGIHDPELEQAAQRAHYTAGFSIERRHARPGANCLALPRYLMTDFDQGARFAAIFAEPRS